MPVAPRFAVILDPDPDDDYEPLGHDSLIDSGRSDNISLVSGADGSNGDVDYVTGDASQRAHDAHSKAVDRTAADGLTPPAGSDSYHTYDHDDPITDDIVHTFLPHSVCDKADHADVTNHIFPGNAFHNNYGHY